MIKNIIICLVVVFFVDGCSHPNVEKKVIYSSNDKMITQKTSISNNQKSEKSEKVVWSNKKYTIPNLFFLDKQKYYVNNELNIIWDISIKKNCSMMNELSKTWSVPTMSEALELCNKKKVSDVIYTTETSAYYTGETLRYFIQPSCKTDFYTSTRDVRESFCRANLDIYLSLNRYI